MDPTVLTADQSTGYFLLKYGAPVPAGTEQASIEDAHHLPHIGTGNAPAPLRATLDAMFPPQTFIDPATGVEVIRRVSEYPAGPAEPTGVLHQLETLLERYHATKCDGFSATRRELFTSAFDELLRMVTVAFPERGIALRAVRDELLGAMNVYASLAKSSESLNNTRDLVSDDFSASLADELQHLKDANLLLETAIADAAAHEKALQAREEERLAGDSVRHQEELAFLRKSLAQITAETKRISGKVS